MEETLIPASLVNWDALLDKLISLGTTLGTKLLAAILILIIGRWIIRRLKKLVNNILEKRQV
ncbi:MAG: mechanosensitive ion channel family protein, partial [Odoribacter sp.]|nr:mechanosensitive ion channel family protein [Odoribacter sp.]